VFNRCIYIRMKKIKIITSLFLSIIVINPSIATQNFTKGFKQIQNGEQIILQKGKDLEINLNQKYQHYQVRVHTSLGSKYEY